MKSRTWLPLAGIWFGLFLVSCGKKEVPAPGDAKPPPVAKAEAPKEKKAEASAPVEEDMPDEEEPASGDAELPPAAPVK